MIRTPLVLIPYLLMMAAVFAGWTWNQGDRIAGLGQTVVSGAPSIGGPFTLLDQHGVRRTDNEFRGRFMLVYFGYTNCPDVCPATLNVMSDALERLGNQSPRIAALFITLDPERDTPRVLDPYMKTFGPKIIGLSGSLKAVTSAAHGYHVYFAKHRLSGGTYAIDHSTTLYLMGPDGKFITFYDESIGPDALAADLRKRL